MNIGQQQFRTIWPVFAAGQALPQKVAVIDQTLLPHDLQIAELGNLTQMIQAIKQMQVRGAPLIGVAAAYGMALATLTDVSTAALQQAAAQLLASRPTAVNLRWAVERMLKHVLALPEPERALAAWHEAAKMADEDVEVNRAIGQHGLALLQGLWAEKQAAAILPEATASEGQAQASHRLNILTHCNAGWLATVDWGTALAPIYLAHEAGLPLHVWVDETRPRNQGASLTAWELAQHGVPHTVISDNAGGHLMQHGLVDCVIVGADRVTRSGDVCNKIGTYLKALAAVDNQLPFYVAVPSPTIDGRIADGLREIPIEERDGDEVSFISGLAADGSRQSVRLTPINTPVANPAFDVTPARLVTGIITEHGCYCPQELAGLVAQLHLDAAAE